MTALLRVVGILIYRLGLARIVRWLNRGVPRVLAYHACEERESAFIQGMECNVTPAVFARQLDILARSYNVIAIDRLEEGHPPPRSVVITFDDGYRSVYDNALPLLRERGLPAIVYLIGLTRDETRLVWMNELNWYLRTRPESASIASQRFGLRQDAGADEILSHARWHETPRSAEPLLERLARHFDVDRKALARGARLYLGTAEIAEMRQAGFLFGNHTETHPNLVLLDEVECRREIAGDPAGAPDDWRKQLHPSFATPFGNHNETVRRVAIESGHRSLMLIGGWNRALDPMRLHRVPIYATKDAEFFAELEVIEPVKAFIRKLLGAPDYGYVGVSERRFQQA